MGSLGVNQAMFDRACSGRQKAVSRIVLNAQAVLINKGFLSTDKTLCGPDRKLTEAGKAAISDYQDNIAKTGVEAKLNSVEEFIDYAKAIPTITPVAPDRIVTLDRPSSAGETMIFGIGNFKPK